MTEPTTAERLTKALAELDITRAHVAFTTNPSDMLRLLAAAPELPASVTAIAPFGTPDLMRDAPWPLTAVLGQKGVPPAMAARAAMLSWPDVVTYDLPSEYEVFGWDDLVADQAGLIVGAIRSAVSRAAAIPAVDLPSGDRMVEGIRVRTEGSGPPLILLPAGIAPTQWDAAVRELAESFTVVRLTGPHLGFLSVIEQRGTAPAYAHMVDRLFDAMEIKDGETVVEVGACSGVLMRQLADRVGSANRLLATDLNGSFLEEGETLARAGGYDFIEFTEANAEALPFDDDSLDVIFSVTAFEECDADAAIREMHRMYFARAAVRA